MRDDDDGGLKKTAKMWKVAGQVLKNGSPVERF